jgi:hypothetical protein
VLPTYNSFSSSGKDADELLKSSQQWEVKLKSLLKERSRRGVAKSGQEEAAIRKALQEAYRGMTVDHYLLASKAGVDAKLWSTWYRPIQVLRGLLKQQKVPDSASDPVKQMFILLGTCERFYKSLVQTLAQKHARLLLEAQQGKSGAHMLPSEQECLRVIFQNSFLALGDLARYAQLYSAKTSENKEWGQAEKHYRQALHIQPTNGRSHNQLAVLASYNSRDSSKENQTGTMRFVAAYFYMRSLACADPFPAKEGLLTLLAKIDKQVRTHTHLYTILTILTIQAGPVLTILTLYSLYTAGPVPPPPSVVSRARFHRFSQPAHTVRTAGSCCSWHLLLQSGSRRI